MLATKENIWSKPLS